MLERGFSISTSTIQFNLYIIDIVKECIDALQIVEQILPYFQPEYTVSMRMVDSMSEVRDVPIF